MQEKAAVEDSLSSKMLHTDCPWEKTASAKVRTNEFGTGDRIEAGNLLTI
jgi:hypothetical protein